MPEDLKNHLMFKLIKSFLKIKIQNDYLSGGTGEEIEKTRLSNLVLFFLL